MKRLSIIIPIYNVEPFLEKCLLSLEDQDISQDDYEIICINDGSPDNSRQVVLRLQEKFDNIILIDQVNQGVSRARNNGINIASGTYMMFIDPDDYVDANSLNRILKKALNQEAQVSFLGYSVLDENGTICNRIFNEINASHVYNGIDAYFISRGDGRTDPDRMWAVLFRTEFLNQNNLRFLPEVPYLEDGEFIARILCLAERCIFDGFSFYQRTTREGSATNSKLFHSEKATSGFLHAASNLKRFQLEQNLNEEQKDFLNQPILKFTLLAINSSIEWKKNKRFSTTIKELKKIDIREVSWKGCNQPYHFYGRVFNISPYLCAFALVVYPRFYRLYRLLFKR